MFEADEQVYSGASKTMCAHIFKHQFIKSYAHEEWKLIFHVDEVNKY